MYTVGGREKGTCIAERAFINHFSWHGRDLGWLHGADFIVSGLALDVKVMEKNVFFRTTSINCLDILKLQFYCRT